jgi:hypothetical protein
MAWPAYQPGRSDVRRKYGQEIVKKPELTRLDFSKIPTTLK